MTAAATEFTTVGIPRDRWGRPLVIPPGGGKKRVAYRRVTTFVGVLEDRYALERWKQRQVAYGLSQRPDLVLAASAVEPDDKERLDEIVDKATEFSSAAATTGTSLHALTERLDRGQKLGKVPEPYPADLKAYQQATARIDWSDIEGLRVYDEWKVAGTPDRVGRINGELVITDIKTGSVDYPSQFAAQLAMYAHSISYDVNDDTRGRPQHLNLDYAVVVHLPAGEGRCQLYRVDIAKGWEACRLAKSIWDWRSVSGLLELTDDTTGITPTLVDLAAAADTAEQLRDLWRQAKADNALTDEFLAVCEARHKQLQEASN
jgi:hypothetical protein